MSTQKPKEKILVVESDPVIRDTIARQSLHAVGYRVRTVGLASSAIQQAVQFSPDLVIANLHLPDLSGKDLMFALQSQGVEIPVVLIAKKGEEAEVIQAFRLGASDYITEPIRETEVISVVERALIGVRSRRERQQLAQELERANLSLKKRVRDMTTLFSIGKAVTSVTDQSRLFDIVIDGGVQIADADLGWLLIREGRKKPFLLRAQRNLPRSLAAQRNKPLDLGLSSLVALSGESLTIHGDALNRFKIAKLGSAALVVPVKAQSEVIGLLIAMRRKGKPFGKSEQSALEAIADYASISIVNAQLFKMLEERAEKLEKALEDVRQGEKIKDEVLQNVSHELRTPLVAAKGYVDYLLDGQMGELNKEQNHSLTITQTKLQRVVDIIEVMTTLHEAATPRELKPIDLNKVADQTVMRFLRAAKRADIVLEAKLSKDPAIVEADPRQITQVFDHLLTNAIKFSPEGGLIQVTVDTADPAKIHFSVKDTGIGISKMHLSKVFERFYQVDGSTTRRFGGVGIGLALVREIIRAHGGSVRVESEIKRGSTFHCALPRARS